MEHQNPLVEICTGSYDSAVAAAEGGARRVELCCALSEGGITPSAGLIRRVVALNGPDVFVLIRPRGGDFLYTSAECDMVADDIRTAVSLGAKGVVVGALTPQGDIDTAAMRLWMDAAKGVSVTFHRAFDLCRRPFDALEEIIRLGCSRLLTSGRATTAEAGIPMLRELIAAAAGRITIMPGSGVTAQNAARIVRETGATELHASARRSFPSRMLYRHEGVGMGRKDADEYTRLETSAESVRELYELLRHT